MQMKAILAILAHEVRYAVPPQNLAVDLRRMPALPESRFIVTQAKCRLSA